MSALTPETRRCAETRAHYAHRWVQAVGVTGLYVDCPGGPDEGALIAEAVDRARAEERERIAGEILLMRIDLDEPTEHDDFARGLDHGANIGYEHAARIARSQP